MFCSSSGAWGGDGSTCTSYYSGWGDGSSVGECFAVFYVSYASIYSE